MPLGIKLAYTLFLLIWIPAYWHGHGWQNFLWLCDIANLVIGLAVWLESPLLFASQAVGVLVIQGLWLVDISGRLLFGLHIIGGTEYMFDSSVPIGLRLLSLFHVFVPLLILWAIARLGYDERGWKLQTALTCALIPLTFWLTDPADNINWIWKPFGIEQTLIPAGLFALVEIVALPLVLYLPTHVVLSKWARRRNRQSRNDAVSQTSETV